MDSFLSRKTFGPLGDSTKMGSSSLAAQNSQHANSNQSAGSDSAPPFTHGDPTRPLNRPVFKMKRTGHHGPSPFAPRGSNGAPNGFSSQLSSNTTPKTTPTNPSQQQGYSLEAFPTGPRVTSSDILQRRPGQASSPVRPSVGSLRDVVRPCLDPRSQ